MPSGRRIIGAGVIACADTATDKAKPATAINLIILFLPPLTVQSLRPLTAEDGPALLFKQRKLPALVARWLEIDQGLYADRAGT